MIFAGVDRCADGARVGLVDQDNGAAVHCSVHGRVEFGFVPAEIRKMLQAHLDAHGGVR